MTAVISWYHSSCHTVVGKRLICISATRQKIQFQPCSLILSAGVFAGPRTWEGVACGGGRMQQCQFRGL